MTQPEDVAKANVEVQPPDSELVIGTVTSGNPLTVAVRNGSINPGRLSTGEIMNGGTVALFRQDATWLALGQIIGANGIGGLGLTQLVVAEASNNLALTAADQPVPGMTVTVSLTNPNGRFLCLWVAEYIILAANTSTSDCRLYLNGVVQANQSAIFRADAANSRAAICSFSLLSPGADGSYTIAAQAKTSGGAALVSLNSTNSLLIVGVFE